MLVAVGCVLLVNAIVGDSGLAGAIKARQEDRQASERLARLRSENARLREQVRRLQADPSAIEGVARQDLGLIRPGEIVVVVKDVK